MQIQYQKLKILLGIHALVFAISCSKKESDSGEESAALEDLTSFSQPVQRIPNRILQSINSEQGLPTILGLPVNPSSTGSFGLSIQGDEWTHFRYGFISSGSECSPDIYSDWQSIGEKPAAKIGSDGPKRICFLFGGGNESSPLLKYYEYYWIKDSVKPSITINSLGRSGPFSTAESQITLSGLSADSSTTITTLNVSLSESSGGCLNSGKTAFNASCPTFHTPSGILDWQFAIDKTLFSDGLDYTLTVTATDQASNQQTNTHMALTWDSSIPGQPANFTASGLSEKVALSWDAVNDAANYLVVRKEAVDVSFDPEAGASYITGQFLGGDHVVAYFGSDISAIEPNLLPNTEYFYEIFSLDTARNLGLGSKDSTISTELARFSGVVSARPVGKGRRVLVSWDAFHDGASAHSLISYHVYSAATSGAQNFATSSEGFVTGKNRIAVEIPGTSSTAFIVVRDVYADSSTGTNTREIEIDLTPDTMFKINNTRIYEDMDISGADFLNSSAITYDSWDNIIFTSGPGELAVYCQEVVIAPYCKNKTVGKTYHLAGQEAFGDGGSDIPAYNAQTGYIWGVDTDSSGNIFLADYTYYRARIICFATDIPGFCFGRTTGNIYHAAGTGTIADGLDDQKAIYQRVGRLRGIAVDSYGNFFLADESYRRIRVVCWVTSGPICSGKTKGNTYRLIGNALAASDTADDVSASSNTMGAIYSFEIDTNNNIYIGDITYYRVRAVCYDTSVGVGFCEGKTIGNTYRILGTGTTGDSADNVVASTEATGRIYGMTSDYASNLWLADQTNKKVRVICYNNVLAGYCQGKTNGNVYHYAFTGVAGDGGNDVDAKATATVNTGLYDVSIDSLGNISALDYTYGRIRLICEDNVSAGVCNGKTVGNHYRLGGVYNLKNGPTSVPSYGSPMGNLRGQGLDSKGNIYVSADDIDQIRVHCLDVSPGTGVCAGKDPGYVYLAAGSGTAGNATDDVDADGSSAHLSNPYSIAFDSHDNMYFTDYSNYRVRAVCWNTAVGTGFCEGKTTGNMYTFAGTGSSADGADDLPAVSTPAGLPYSIAVDSNDNIFFTDITRHRVRVVCIDVASAGFCQGKHDPASDGVFHHYRVAGIGSPADGDQGVSTATGMSTPYGMAIDPSGNIYVTDVTYDRLRVTCFDVSVAGFCNGKTAGNSYRFAGTGTAADGLDDEVALSSTIMNPYALAVDPGGNVFMAGGTYERVRIICNDVSYGRCIGKTQGNIYHLFGTGIAGISASGSPGTTSKMGVVSPSGLNFQSDGTLVFSDGTYDTIQIYLPIP